MPNVQWNDIPFRLQSPVGTLDFNRLLGTVAGDPPSTGSQWLLIPEGCQAGSVKRVARDNSPQKGGEIVHRKFKAGIVFQLQLLGATIVSTDPPEMTPCCGANLVDLFDELLLHLNAMENNNGRLFWKPSGYPKTMPGPPSTVTNARMVDAARWLGADGQAGGAFTSVVTAPDDNVFTTAQFALLSPFPYAMDAEEIDTNLGGSSPTTVHQTGNTDFFPVIEVFGPTGNFEIRNLTTGLKLVYDAALPGAAPILGGDFVEFDFFRETAYFDGDQANAKPGIDILNSDFWPLVPGNNIIEIDGASALMKWQAAYTG